jgi:hypothetical protein
VAKGDGLHFVRRCHFKIKRDAQNIHQSFDIGIRNVTTILAKVCRDAICASLLGHPRRAQWVGIGTAACVTHGCHMVYINP